MRRYTIYEETSTIRKKDFNPDMSFVEFIWMNSSPDMVYASACREEAMKEFERLNREAGVTHDNTNGTLEVKAYWVDEEELDEDGEWCFCERWDSTDLYEKYQEWELEKERDFWLVDWGTRTEEIYGTSEEVMKQVDEGLTYTQESVQISCNKYGEEYIRVWHGVELNKDDFDSFDLKKVITFGNFGYYEPWQDEGGEYL